MKRRDFIVGAAASAFGLAEGAEQCVDHPQGQGRLCNARIDMNRFGHVKTQDKSFWCWAATLQMIFAYHDRHVSQASIVRQTFGQTFNLAASPRTLIQSVNRTYTTTKGSDFEVNAKIWGVDYGIAQIDNSTMIESIGDDDDPMVYCNMSHMMVLVGVRYQRSFSGMFPPKVLNAWVADPWPGATSPIPPGRPALPSGFRYLSIPEMTPAYLGGQMRFLAVLSID